MNNKFNSSTTTGRDYTLKTKEAMSMGKNNEAIFNEVPLTEWLKYAAYIHSRWFRCQRIDSCLSDYLSNNLLKNILLLLALQLRIMLQ